MPDRPLLVVWALVVGYAVIYSILSGLRYRYYLHSDYDLAIFAQAVDGILHGRLYSSIRGMYWLGDHSSLILFLVAPVYALFRHPLTLLILQSAAQAAGAFPVYALARRELGHPGLAVICAGFYLLYPALGYANLFEFHPETLATPALLAAFHFLRAGRLRATLGWATAALLCREDVALVIFMMALYALVRRPPRAARFALGLTVAAAASMVMTWGVLRPVFSHGEAEYARIYAQWGSTPGSVALRMLGDPIGVVTSLISTPGNPFDTLIKLQYHATLLLPLGLLPLLSPLTLAIALPVMAEHLLSWRTPQHTILYQYTALVTPFMLAATVLGLRNVLCWLAPRRPRRTDPRRETQPRGGRAAALAMVWALAAGLGSHVWFGPLLSSGRFFVIRPLGRHLPTGGERARARACDRMLARVPDRGGVVASLELLNRFTDRDSVYSLRQVTQPSSRYSTRARGIPTGISAMIADLSATSSAVGPETPFRLRELALLNRLVLVDAADDILLFLTEAPDTLGLVAPGACAAGHQRPLVFDDQLAFLGVGAMDSTVSPGRPCGFRELWPLISGYYGPFAEGTPV